MVIKNKDKPTLDKPLKPGKDNHRWEWGWRPPIWIDKWTDEIIIEELEDMYQVLNSDKDIIYIWELFSDKPYSRSSFIQQVGNRKDNEYVCQVYNTIKEILETRAARGLIKNELNPTWTIFHLKNNYKWVDKQEIDQTNKNLNLNKDVSELSDKELDEIINE